MIIRVSVNTATINICCTSRWQPFIRAFPNGYLPQSHVWGINQDALRGDIPRPLDLDKSFPLLANVHHAIISIYWRTRWSFLEWKWSCCVWPEVTSSHTGNTLTSHGGAKWHKHSCSAGVMKTKHSYSCQSVSVSRLAPPAAGRMRGRKGKELFWAAVFVKGNSPSHTITH